MGSSSSSVSFWNRSNWDRCGTDRTIRQPRNCPARLHRGWDNLAEEPWLRSSWFGIEGYLFCQGINLQMPVSPLSSSSDISGCNHHSATGLEWISISVALSLPSPHHWARGLVGWCTQSQSPSHSFRSFHKIYEINKIATLSTLPSKLFQHLSTEPKKSCSFVQFLLHWIKVW